MNYLHYKAREIVMLIAIAAALCAAAVMLSGCSSQVVTTPNGQTVVNNNFLSKGTLSIKPDGSIDMAGDAEKAAAELARYGKVYLQWRAVPGVIDAASQGTTKVTEALR